MSIRKFNIVLVDPGYKLIEVIREIRVITGLGLKDSKDLVELAQTEPVMIMASVDKAQADKTKTLLNKCGAKVDIELDHANAESKRKPSEAKLNKMLSDAFTRAMSGAR